MKYKELRKLIREELAPELSDSWMQNSPLPPEQLKQMEEAVDGQNLRDLKISLRLTVTEMRNGGFEDDDIIEYITTFIQGV